MKMSWRRSLSIQIDTLMFPVLTMQSLDSHLATASTTLLMI